MTTLAEYHARLAVEPLTSGQLGAVHGQFRRLGYPVADRPGRLKISAALARYPGDLASTKDLTMGEAGRLIGALESCRNLADIEALAEPPEPEPTPVVMPWRDLMAALAVALYGSRSC